jgi:hypothetical protein
MKQRQAFILGNKRNSEKLSEADKLTILAVKAIEENEKGLFNDITVARANIIALSSRSDTAYIYKRAEFLFSLLPYSFKAVLHVTGIKSSWIKTVLFLSFITGLTSNYLGAAQNIHIFYNPLTMLLAWNLLVYLFIVIKKSIHIGIPTIKAIKAKKNDLENDTNEDVNIHSKNFEHTPNFLVRWIAKRLFKRMTLLTARYDEKKSDVLIVKKIITPLWHEYLGIAGKSIVYKVKTLINISAIGIVLGALAGIYLRGLFFKYNVVWQSTFVSEPETVRFFLNILFGPASLLLHAKLITSDDIKMLLVPDGMTAAPWIHLMAVTTVIYALIPRTLLALYYYFKEKISLNNIDFNTDYYQNHILKNRKSIVEAVKTGIKEIITKKIDRLSIRIADFVVQDFYDGIVEPILREFREKGGKIKDFEEKLTIAQEKFEPILTDYLKKVEEEFKESVVTEINLFLGRNFDIRISTGSSYQLKNSDFDKNLSGKMAGEIGDTLSGTIVTTMAITVGSLTGGLGKSIGTAILVSLIGVSGPVGMLMGAVAAAATLGGMYKYKRDKVTVIIKEIPLPATIVALTLTKKKMQKTREETLNHTRNEIKKMIEPEIDKVTEKVLKEFIY